MIIPWLSMHNMVRSNTKYLLVSVGLLLLGFFLFKFYKLNDDRLELPSIQKTYNSQRSNQITKSRKSYSNSEIPSKVYKVWDYIKKYHKAPDGYIGGREFKNREHQLDVKTTDGRFIHYQEWDVNPKVPGQNRGRERLITADDKRAWYTKDHYKTFTELNYNP